MMYHQEVPIRQRGVSAIALKSYERGTGFGLDEEWAQFLFADEIRFVPVRLYQMGIETSEQKARKNGGKPYVAFISWDEHKVERPKFAMYVCIYIVGKSESIGGVINAASINLA